MALTEIVKKVVSYCEIPEHLTEKHWISEHQCGAHVEVHLDDEENDPLSVWLAENYPELKEEVSFFIHLDY